MHCGGEESHHEMRSFVAHAPQDDGPIPPTNLSPQCASRGECRFDRRAGPLRLVFPDLPVRLKFVRHEAAQEFWAVLFPRPQLRLGALVLAVGSLAAQTGRIPLPKASYPDLFLDLFGLVRLFGFPDRLDRFGFVDPFYPGPCPAYPTGS